MSDEKQGRYPSKFIIPILCLVAVVCPLRADSLTTGSVRLEFFWTQIHKLFGGISWQNAEILFPLGAFTLLFVAFYFAVAVCGMRRSAVSVLWLCFILHVLFRGFVDFYLVTRYFPLRPSYIRGYWTLSGAGWRVLAFTGGVASVVAVVVQARLLWKRSRKTSTTVSTATNEPAASGPI